MAKGIVTPFSVGLFTRYSTKKIEYHDMVRDTFRGQLFARGGETFWANPYTYGIPGYPYILITRSDWPHTSMDDTRFQHIDGGTIEVKSCPPERIYGEKLDGDYSISNGTLSKNGKYLTVCSAIATGIIDLHKLEYVAIFYKTAYSNNHNRGDTNHDGSRIYMCSTYDVTTNTALRCFDTTTGALIYSTAVPVASSYMWHDPDTALTWVIKSDKLVQKIDETGAITDSITMPNSLYVSEGMTTRSHDGRYLPFASSGNGGFFDCVTETIKVFHPSSALYTAPMWLSENVYVIWAYSSYGVVVHVKDYDLEKADGYSATTSPSTYFYEMIIIPAYGRWEATIDVTNTSGEQYFFAEAYCNNEVCGRAFLNNPSGQISIMVSTNKHVDIVLSGIRRDLRRSSTTYAVGDEIQVLDTNYIYECTTGGTTDTIEVAYPNTGSVTDGTAVFLTKHKIAESLHYNYVAPSPRY